MQIAIGESDRQRIPAGHSVNFVKFSRNAAFTCVFEAASAARSAQRSRQHAAQAIRAYAARRNRRATIRLRRTVHGSRWRTTPSSRRRCARCPPGCRDRPHIRRGDGCNRFRPTTENSRCRLNRQAKRRVAGGIGGSAFGRQRADVAVNQVELQLFRDVERRIDGCLVPRTRSLHASPASLRAPRPGFCSGPFAETTRIPTAARTSVGRHSRRDLDPLGGIPYRSFRNCAGSSRWTGGGAAAGKGRVVWTKIGPAMSSLNRSW